MLRAAREHRQSSLGCHLWQTVVVKQSQAILVGIEPSRDGWMVLELNVQANEMKE